MAAANSVKKSKSIQKTVHWEPEVLEALEAHMKRERINNFSIAVNDAVKFGLFPEYRDDRSADLVKLYQQLSHSVAEHRKKTGRDLMIMQEMMLQLMKVILTHTNALPEKERLVAEKQANVRLDRLVEEIIRKLPVQKGPPASQ
ncbi:MAG: hypothetical protein KKA05_11025 [Alphaproteobacteria bacterium]|nr:hypothetical protein [Alphaproteobacteria bacterium]